MPNDHAHGDKQITGWAKNTHKGDYFYEKDPDGNWAVDKDPDWVSTDPVWSAYNPSRPKYSNMVRRWLGFLLHRTQQRSWGS